jgi:hypothetical protein
VWLDVSQTGVSVGQVLLLLQDAPQVCPLEQFGVLPEQSDFRRQSTQAC